ncbi:hypothetical protein FBUS_03383 [Fasciolopsis buskii]|uniref:Uncharacterized protein n=1 Tax=Fasciolopsis buskii TaxID=27845 RepID=A0A8E0RZE9_9TREM|nr:hypothetical protein FBUS_03383 [Fasciolopsis buski]
MADSEVEQAVGGPDSVWWLSLLPYKPSNLPTNLADRLRQRNSLVLARCSPSARLSNSSLPTPLPYLGHPNHQVTGIGSRLTAVNGGSGPSQTAMMMTQSLYEQRDTADQMYAPANSQLSPADPATPHGSRHDLHAPRMSSRFRLPTRPSSLYLDKPDTPVVFMPSLAHLSGLGCSSSSGETGLSRCTWDRHASASQANQSDGSSPVPRTSPSLSGDSIPISMSSSYNAANMPLIEAAAPKGWSVDKTDSPLLGQYCRLLNLRADHNTTSSNNNNSNFSDRLGTSATPADLPTPSAETPLTPV